METAKPFHLQKIAMEFSKRQSKNSSYSLRAFAKFLAIDSSTLSAVLNERRRLPLPAARKIAQKLHLSDSEAEKFLQSVRSTGKFKQLLSVPNGYNSVVLQDKQTQILTEWEYFALLSLMENSDFSANPVWIARRLDLKVERVKQIIKNLEEALLINRDSEGKLLAAQRLPPTFNMAKSDLASLKKASREAMRVALEKMDSTPEDLCHFSSMTLALSSARLAEAKEIIREFRRRLGGLLEADESDEVYKLNIQFFPLTSPKRD